jgi:microcystin-dependent protein
MAESDSPRFGVRRWSAGTDTFSRAELDASMAAIEAKGAIFLQGTRAARPAAGVVGRYYMVVGDGTAANNGLLFYDNGSSWITVGTVLEGVTVRSTATGNVSMIVDMISGQTANLQQWRNSAGIVLAYIDVSGNANVKGLTATSGQINGSMVITGDLTVNGTTTMQTSSSGTSQVTSMRSSALRSDGQAKTQIDVDGFARVDGLIPPGTIVMTGRSTAPTGWALCNGASDTTAAQPDLFAAIGYEFGGSAGNFNVPNLSDKFPLGVSGAANKTIGDTGGAHSKTLTSSHLPAHTHTHSHTHSIDHSHTASASSTDVNHVHTGTTDTDGYHWHGYYREAFTNIGYVAGGTGALVASGSAYLPDTAGAGSHAHYFTSNGMNTNTVHSHTITVPSHTGSSGAASTSTTSSTGNASPSLDVTPAYVALNYIIKL